MIGSAYELVTRRLAEKTGWHPTAPKGDWKCPGHLDNNPRWPAVLKLNHRGQQIRTSLFTDSSTVQLLQSKSSPRTFQS